MNENTDGDTVCSRIEEMVDEFENSRDPDLTEIGRQFTQLQRTMVVNKDVLSCDEGTKPINRLKNRYKDILPYDKYRVILESNDGSDYINASFVEDLSGHRRYVAAQGPIDSSLVDFFHMIWNLQITSIVCTANDIEAGRMKYRRYWPDGCESLQYGPYRITKDETSDKSYRCNNYEIRPLTITCGDTQRHAILYHFLHWFDHDIPNDEASIIELLLRIYQDRSSLVDSPILIHCSAGCGRTGSLIAIDLCRLLLSDQGSFFGKDYQPYPIFKIASHIRQFRIALIQTLKQYLFVHKMLIFMMKLNGGILLSPISKEKDDESYSSSSSQSTQQFPIPSSSRRQSATLQIILRTPPTGRRILNSSNMPSPAISPSETCTSPSKYLSLNDTTQTSEPPPIPPRVPLTCKTKTHRADDLVYSNEICHKTQTILARPRYSRQKLLTSSKCTRSDSADVYLMSLYKHHGQYLNEQGAYSD